MVEGTREKSLGNVLFQKKAGVLVIDVRIFTVHKVTYLMHTILMLFKRFSLLRFIVTKSTLGDLKNR